MRGRGGVEGWGDEPGFNKLTVQCYWFNVGPPSAIYTIMQIH